MPNQDLLDRISELDPELAAETANALDEASLKSKVYEAEERLSQACNAASFDPTGQDTENLQNNAAADLIDARDELERHQDPEGFAERQRGA